MEKFADDLRCQAWDVPARPETCARQRRHQEQRRHALLALRRQRVRIVFVSVLSLVCLFACFSVGACLLLCNVHVHTCPSRVCGSLLSSRICGSLLSSCFSMRVTRAWWCSYVQVCHACSAVQPRFSAKHARPLTLSSPTHAYTRRYNPRADSSTSCVPQTRCDPGHAISADSKTSARRCNVCPDGTFQDGGQHRLQCTVWSVCTGEGQFEFAKPTRLSDRRYGK